MKILHLITHFDLGGAERVAANIAASPTAGMEYHVLEIMRGSSAYTPKFISELRAAGVRCHRSWMPDVQFHFLFERIAALLFPLRMLFVMLRLRPDVVHTHTETPDLALYVCCRLMPWLFRRVRVVRTIHNTCLWTGLPRTATCVERFFQQRRANIAISASVLESYSARFGSEPPIIHNGVASVPQEPFFAASPEEVTSAASATTSRPIEILFAGRFEPQKGVDMLCQVVKALRDDARYRFTIAGDGSLRSLVERELGSLPNVSVLSPIFSLATYMSSFDYLFMPSLFEGLSMLSMEASMNGLPVIANACPGLADTLPPTWSLLARSGTLEEYMHIFRSVIPGVSHDALADEAYVYASQHFSIRTMQLRYEQVYAARC